MSSFVINSGFCSIPFWTLELGTFSAVSTLNKYFPFEYESIPLKCESKALMFSKIDLSVAKIKLVWCRVTAYCLFSSHPKYLQYFTKSESYKLYSGVLPSAPSVKVLGPLPVSLVSDIEEMYLNPFVVPVAWVGAVDFIPAVVTR